MEEKLQEFTDGLTTAIMGYFYGERFIKSDDITDDEELINAWEFINENVFGTIWAAYDEGFDNGVEDSEQLKQLPL